MSRLTPKSSVASVSAALLLAGLTVSGATAAPSGPNICTWGGTPLDTTGTFTVKPGLTNTPSTEAAKLHAIAPIECTDGYSGKASYMAVTPPGSTCAFSTFEGKVTGIPGADQAIGVGPVGLITHNFYDKDGNLVGTDQGQVLSGATEGGSEASDCNTEKGFTKGFFSTVIELAGG
jgi:hypothetical protein